MSEQLDSWGDLQVGDRVCFMYRNLESVARDRQYDLVELWSTTAPISGQPDAVAVIRDAHGVTMTANVRVLRRLSPRP